MSNKEQYIREIIAEDENILTQLDNSPHTYNSLLGDYKDNGTFQQILRRRLKRLLKEGLVWKIRVPGTRFGLVIFIKPEHDYQILTSHTLNGVDIYYMYDYKDEERAIILDNYWQLNDKLNHWRYYEEQLIIPKYSLRDRGFRIWY